MRIAFLVALVTACGHPPTATSPTPLDVNAPWTMCQIVQGTSTGLHRGADGTDYRFVGAGYRIVTGLPSDTDMLVVVSPDEEGSNTTISTETSRGAPGACGTWATVDVPISQSGPEDAKFGDFDGDGVLDAAIIARSKIWLVFGNGDGTYTAPVALTATVLTGQIYWLQAATVDLDGDGNADLVAGPYGGAGTALTWVRNPGGASKRDGTAWTATAMRSISRPMTIDCGSDLDGDGRPECYTADRDGIGSPKSWQLWASSWTHNATGDAAPQVFGGHSACGTNGAGCTGHGDAMMGAIVDWTGDGKPDLVQAYSHTGTPNYVAIYDGANPTQTTTWPVTYVTSSAINTNTGHAQAVVTMPLDGKRAICMSSWELNSPAEGDSTASGVICAIQQADGSFSRVEVSGPRGTKFDNLQRVPSRDVPGCYHLLTSEQNYDKAREGQPNPNGPTGGIGVVEYLNPTCIPTTEADGPPDAAVDAPHECGS